MTIHDFALSGLAARLLDTDASLSTSLREILSAAMQELIEAELTATIGAAPGERTAERVTQRNGHRPKLISVACRSDEAGPGDRPRSRDGGPCRLREACSRGPKRWQQSQRDTFEGGDH
jgi:hypothetical protein